MNSLVTIRLYMQFVQFLPPLNFYFIFIFIFIFILINSPTEINTQILPRLNPFVGSSTDFEPRVLKP